MKTVFARLARGMLLAVLVTTATATPKRLSIVDRLILDDAGSVIQLRGGNLKGATTADAADLKNNLKMNFARLPIEWNDDTRDPNHDSGLKPDYLSQIDGWVQALSGAGIWFVLEMRLDDPTSKLPDLYSPTGATYLALQKTWVYLAKLYKDTDYVAGYGLLAEPSASAFNPEPWSVLTTFQKALMDQISAPVASGGAGDTWTPFFVGTDFNYDTMQYRYDGYYTALASYRGRLIYEVNVLMPKPWIQDGSAPAGVPPENALYPQATQTDFTPLLTLQPGEKDGDGNVLELPRDSEKVFNLRRKEPANFPLMLCQNFLTWYLQWAVDFSTRNAVPLYVDQFGADITADDQLGYERDLIEVVERADLPWTRWGYTAGQPGRKIVGNTDVTTFYTTVGARTASGQLMVWQPDTNGLVRIEAVSYGIAAAGPAHDWRYFSVANALGRGAVRALPADDVSKSAANAPRLDFRVNFAQAGTYYVWVRLKNGTSSTGVWFGLDGAASTQKLSSDVPTSWRWVRGQGNVAPYASVTVTTAGLHTFNVWMNRSGIAVDDIVLTPSSTWTPPGTLPDYSLRTIDAPLPP
ncbi:MAG: cellulase family glycosylhydrolase [Candidatus Didemnitutus sp.]|nr:cellulase family glycosylhydrolase [Candidatus Didemnitutus sp.]